jgi:hypothetical protein
MVCYARQAVGSRFASRSPPSPASGLIVEWPALHHLRRLGDTTQGSEETKEDEDDEDEEETPGFEI